MIIRTLDIILSILLLICLSPFMLLILVLLYFDTGSPLFAQRRLERKQMEFILFKFRTMALNTESVGTHLVNKSSVTPMGKFLRKTKLDELPQLVNVLKGEMSFVGPRPCLPNQLDVINERKKLNVFSIKPGITGLSQLNNVDMSQPVILAITDRKLMESITITTYFKFIFQTACGKGRGDNVNIMR